MQPRRLFLAKPKRLANRLRLNPVPASSRAGQHAPTASELERCADLYERFSGQDAVEIGMVDLPPMPKAAVAIGDCDGILYTTVRDGVVEKYIHKFNKADRPLLVVDSTGKTLYLIGGRYTFTERGIVDQTDPSNHLK